MTSGPDANGRDAVRVRIRGWVASVAAARIVVSLLSLLGPPIVAGLVVRLAIVATGTVMRTVTTGGAVALVVAVVVSAVAAGRIIASALRLPLTM